MRYTFRQLPGFSSDGKQDSIFHSHLAQINFNPLDEEITHHYHPLVAMIRVLLIYHCIPILLLSKLSAINSGLAG